MKHVYNVLVTGVGGPTPRGFVRSVLGAGCNSYRFFGTDANPHAIGLYDRKSFHSTYLVPSVSSLDYWSSIFSIVKKHQIDFAIVMPEVELIEWAKAAEEKRLPCNILVSSSRVLSEIVDKDTLHEILVDKVYLPEFCAFENGGDVSHVSLAYPFWVRGTLGSSGLGSLKVNNSSELKEWMRLNPGVKRYIASEFLPGRNLACKLLYVDGALVRSACAERVEYIMAKVSPSGITGNTSFGRLINDRGLVDIADDAIQEVFGRHNDKPNGIFTVDLKESVEGKPMLTEINVRCVAFVSALAEAGANIPLDILDSILNPASFSLDYHHYSFKDEFIFLRDVDEAPLLLKESELLTRGGEND